MNNSILLVIAIVIAIIIVLKALLTVLNPALYKVFEKYRLGQSGNAMSMEK